MACILKIPDATGRGVVTFTTPERDHVILKDPKLQNSVNLLKSKWIVGLHHNWHDFSFRYNPLFDFSMAGEGDLKEVNGAPFPLVPMDACNFVPGCFESCLPEKFWDIIFVGRAVYFKRIPEFFKAIRSLYDSGNRYRVLQICPIPPYDKRKVASALYQVRELYDGLFSEEEKDFFTLLTTTYRDPSPFDLPTLSRFYALSRVFVHTANDERRCRVAAYAWASGLPVVGMDCVGSILPARFSREPYFFRVSSDHDYPVRIKAAVEEARKSSADFNPVREFVCSSQTIPRLVSLLSNQFHLGNGGKWFTQDLDIRFGRHHQIDSGPNGIPSSLTDFVGSLSNHEMLLELGSSHPERELHGRLTPGSKGKKAAWWKCLRRNPN